jgi:spore maturation protein CgeB
MRFVLFCHSVSSCWNNGNAHFLRGIVRELHALGHQVAVYEPADGWSRANLTADFTQIALEGFRGSFPFLRPELYRLKTIDLDRALHGADVVLVHEWNDPRLVAAIGRKRVRGGQFILLFHDTHHRAMTDPNAMAAYDLEGYDGVLAFGEVIREIYLRRGWSRRAWTWHEGADIAHFRPQNTGERSGDLVWIGNWGDDERAAELQNFLLQPAQRLGLKSIVHGVRYPQSALEALTRHGIEYRGWLANHRVPVVLQRFGVTVHIPRRPYVEALPGIPTIRVFEALACGVPLICSPWDDTEGLFRPGTDFLLARSGEEMTQLLRLVLSDRALARDLATKGLETIRARHTCRHRVLELLQICRELGLRDEQVPPLSERSAVGSTG